MSILEALGISEFPAPDSLSKILKDHLVCERTQELMVQRFAAEVIQKMHPLEKKSLLKRITPPAPVAPPVHLVTWRIEGGLISGKAFLKGHCGRCGQDCHFDGKPGAVAGLIWAHCALGPSKPPEEIVAAYAQAFNGRGL